MYHFTYQGKRYRAWTLRQAFRIASQVLDPDPSADYITVYLLWWQVAYAL